MLIYYLPLTLAFALALDLVFGDPPNALHPTAWMGSVIAFGKRHSPVRGAVAQFVYGALVIIFGAGAFALIAYFGLNAIRAWNEIAFILASALILKTTFTLRGLIRAARDVQRALAANHLIEARRLVAWHLVSRNTRELDAPHVTSATVESVAENLADSIVAPLFFFAILGLPGALAYRFINTADAMIGYHGATEYLGKFAARLDDVLNFIPSRVAGLLIVIGALFARCDARDAWRVMMRDHSITASPNAGYPMSAMAGALNVQLEKIGNYKLGDATREFAPSVISQSLRVMIAGAAIWILLLVISTIQLSNYLTK
ncbi:MAG: cobalamin biosynthesis protein [Chloroflexi bacterium]|nr:cobalamin biosynthesis protein [Chloroflexota bacterium]